MCVSVCVRRTGMEAHVSEPEKERMEGKRSVEADSNT